MIPSASIDELASRLHQRNAPGNQDTGPGPYILFLGGECSLAAGAPSSADIARRALRTFDFESIPDDLNDEEVLRRFASHTASFSSSQLARMLQSLYARVAVPSFYQDLALLVRERYFPLIITTNFDTLLEQALTAVGVRSTDVRITTFGSRTSSPDVADPTEQPLTHLVKLHGDLAQNAVYFLPEDVERTLRSSRNWIKSDLKGDILMVGHLVSDDPVDSWLGHSPSRELWWISGDPPAQPELVRSWATEFHEVTGETGQPSVFFAQLVLRLLRAPPAPKAGEDPWETEDYDYASGFSPGLGRQVPPSELLRQELLRSQAVLYSLDQTGIAGDRPSNVQAQIEYQKKLVSRLEDQLRSLPEVRPQVIDLVRKIGNDVLNYRTSVSSANLGQISEYLQTQVATLSSELVKATPNQILVSALLGATLTAADRIMTEFGPKAVDPDDVKQLAALAPTIASKVVL